MMQRKWGYGVVLVVHLNVGWQMQQFARVLPPLHYTFAFSVASCGTSCPRPAWQPCAVERLRS